jgi:hypothetical protein
MYHVANRFKNPTTTDAAVDGCSSSEATANAVSRSVTQKVTMKAVAGFIFVLVI